MDQDRYQPYRDIGAQPFVPRPEPLSLQEVAAKLGAQPAPKRTPQAEVVLKALIVEIEALHSDVAALLGRLTPVLRSEPPTKDPDGTARPITGAPLIDELQRQIALLSRLRGVVRGAIDRLEV